MIQAFGAKIENGNWFCKNKETNKEKGRWELGVSDFQSDFISNCDYFDRVVIPPNSSIGYHKHSNNEELYIILEGRATMIIEQKEIVVKKGDMIKNPPFGKHGLTNDSDTDLDMLIIRIRIDN